jgi:hypothetical protein
LFLLLIYDFSRCMWIALIPSKHCASKAVKRIRAETDARLGKKLS